LPIRVNDCTGRTSQRGPFDEIVAIKVFAAQGDEKFAVFNRPRIRADLVDYNISVASRKRASGQLSNLRKRKRIHKTRPEEGMQRDSRFQNKNIMIQTPRDGLRSHASRLEYRRTGRCDLRTPGNFRALCPQSKQCRAGLTVQWRD